MIFHRNVNRLDGALVNTNIYVEVAVNLVNVDQQIALCVLDDGSETGDLTIGIAVTNLTVHKDLFAVDELHVLHCNAKSIQISLAGIKLTMLRVLIGPCDTGSDDLSPTLALAKIDDAKPLQPAGIANGPAIDGFYQYGRDIPTPGLIFLKGDQRLVPVLEGQVFTSPRFPVSSQRHKMFGIEWHGFHCNAK